MKHINIVRTAVMTFALASWGMNCFASDNVNINITGKVIASPCTTINGGSADLMVALGDNIGASTLSAANSGSPLIPVELNLTGCPAGTANVHATFTGTPDADTTLWKNDAASAATNTAVELSDVTGGTLISNGDTRDAVVVDGAATYKLQARAVSTLGGALPGDISTTIVVALTYQ